MGTLPVVIATRTRMIVMVGNAREDGAGRGEFVRWSPGDAVPDAAFIRLSPAFIRPDPVFGDLRQWSDEDKQESLDASVAREGVLQPIAVRFLGEEQVTIPVLVWGRRRLRSVLRAGLEEVMVRNLGRLSNRDALLFQLVENEHREPLHLVDDALGIARLIEQYSASQAEAARLIGRSEATVSILGRAGVALQLLSGEELEELYELGPSLTFRALSALVSNARSSKELAQLLLEFARSEASRRRPGRPRGRATGPAFLTVPNKRGGGERFTVRWSDADLARGGVKFVESMSDFLLKRLEAAVRRAEELRGQRTSRPKQAGPPEKGRGAYSPLTAPAETGSHEDDLPDLDAKRFEELLADVDARLKAVRKRLRQGPSESPEGL